MRREVLTDRLPVQLSVVDAGADALLESAAREVSAAAVSAAALSGVAGDGSLTARLSHR